MTFDELMAEVVGSRILGDAALRRAWDAFVGNRDSRALNQTCGKAENIPDTEKAALYYSLIYQRPHYDALLQALGATPDAIPATGGRWLLADFGAGPATALLAFAQHIHRKTAAPLDVTYVHVDRLASMRALAERYFDRRPHMTGGSTLLPVPEITPNMNVAPWVEGVGQALFVFSYVLCQPSLDDGTVRAFASAVAQTCKALGNRPACILMTDTNLPRSRWSGLVGHLRGMGLGIQDASTKPLDCTVVYLRPDGSRRDSRATQGKTMYAAARLQ